MTPDVLNSGQYNLTFINGDQQSVNLGAVIPFEYKMYTDAEGAYLYVKFTSPNALLDLKLLRTIKKISLDFFHLDGTVINGYNFEISGYTWELEGAKGENRLLMWEVIFALKLETIEININGNKSA